MFANIRQLQSVHSLLEIDMPFLIPTGSELSLLQ